MIESLFHCNVNVTDLDRSLPFYQLLGFQIIVDFREGMSSPELAKALGLSQAELRGVHLSAGDNPNLTRIDLVEFQNPKTEGQPYPHLHHTGINRISIRTNNISETYKNLKEKGVNFLSEPVTLPGTNFTFVCFPDPDGTILQLVEGSL
ncbi:VOC family protein [Aetokthonos hydrillicola]|nr:VOC family protein [Aetokthonos hydrillicola]MBW4586555.1 VOC family protein [Aetokthonos hydrillicola CCALA 1050]